MHCTACKVQGGSQIYGGAGRCHKQPHTAHPRRNKVRGGAHKKWKHTGTVALDRAQAREESFPWFVQSSRLLLQSRSDRLRLQVQDWLLVVRWPHRGGRWSSVLFGKPTRKDVCVETLQEGTVKCSHLLTDKVCSTLVSLYVYSWDITSERGDRYTLPTLPEEDVVDNICGDTLHFSEAETSLPVHARPSRIGPLAGHVLTRGWAALQTGIRHGDMRRWLHVCAIFRSRNSQM